MGVIGVVKKSRNWRLASELDPKKVFLGLIHPGAILETAKRHVFGRVTAALQFESSVTRHDLVTWRSPPKMGRDHGFLSLLKSRELTIVLAWHEKRNYSNTKKSRQVDRFPHTKARMASKLSMESGFRPFERSASSHGFESLPVDIPTQTRRRVVESRGGFDAGGTAKSWSDVSTGALFEMELDMDENEHGPISAAHTPEERFPISLSGLSIDEESAFQGSFDPARGESAHLQAQAAQRQIPRQISGKSSIVAIPKRSHSSRRVACSM